MVEELLPTAITLMVQINMKKRIVLRFYRLSDECHMGLPGSSAGFFHVAFSTGTNDISPKGFAAHTPWDYVVERQFAGRITFAAILTTVFIAGEDVSAIKLYFVSRQTVVE